LIFVEDRPQKNTRNKLQGRSSIFLAKIKDSNVDQDNKGSRLGTTTTGIKYFFEYHMKVQLKVKK